MTWFLSKQTSNLGIDLGTTSLKAVEIAKVAGKSHLKNYAYVEHVSDILRARDQAAKTYIAQLLRKMLTQAGIKTVKAATALPNFAVFSAVMSVPVLKKSEELDAAIRWEAKKFVPLPLEEMNLKWEILLPAKPALLPSVQSAPTGQEKIFKPAKPTHQEVLITAASRSMLADFVDIFALAKLQLVSVETESLALARSLVGRETVTVMLIDIGAISTDIAVIENGMPIIARSIDVGGQTITKAIGQYMNIDEKRAEQFKRDLGLDATNQEGMRRLIDSTFQSVVNEVRYSLELYQHRGRGQVQKVVLAGGSAYLNGMVDYLSNILRLPVSIGDSWQFVTYPPELKPLLDELGPRFAVAIGLAMNDLV